MVAKVHTVGRHAVHVLLECFLVVLVESRFPVTITVQGHFCTKKSKRIASLSHSSGHVYVYRVIVS